MNKLALASLSANPQAERWLGFEEDGCVILRTGKVELGQGILIALAQIAADALCVDLDQIRIVSGDTAVGPDEGWTSGSASTRQSGGAIGVVASMARNCLLQIAAARCAMDSGCLRVECGQVLAGDRVLVPPVDYWRCAAEVLAGASTMIRRGLLQPESLPELRAGTQVGTSSPRLTASDGPAGRRFIQDMDFPGMLHARVLRPANPLARLVSGDAAALKTLEGVHDVVIDGSFVAIVGEDEAALVLALPAASKRVRWTTPALPACDTVLQGTSVAHREDAIGVAVERGFLTGASIGTSTSIALWRDESDGAVLEVWSHSQGVFALQRQVAKAHGLTPERVRVRHALNAGCYGHNGADDAAFEATLVARRFAGRHVRLVWTREDELGWSPMGSAMRVEIEAALAADGSISRWSSSIRSGTHANRPGWGDGIRFVAGALLAEPLPWGELADLSAEMGYGGQRNAWPLYEVGQPIIHYQLVPTPVRTSSLRALGAHVNVVAIESMMDELAQAAGQDPVTFRLKQLKDERAKAVIARVAEMARWEHRQSRDEALGLAFARYKNQAAYMAVVVALDLSTDARVSEVWAAVDAGLVINPDGARNQVEGGIVQALSWTLREEVRWDEQGFLTGDWESYPIFRFDDIPRIQLELVNPKSGEPLGVGEVAAGPTAAAVANALATGLGVRLGRMPFTRERIIKALA
jgi:nicotinate dehydrogenase subunit B